MLRNYRKPLTLYKCMKKWYISQAFSIFSTRYKKWSIYIYCTILCIQNILYLYLSLSMQYLFFVDLKIVTKKRSSFNEKIEC